MNQSGRMEKVREALSASATAIGFALAEKNRLSLDEMRLLQPRLDAALAEVEETEARLAAIPGLLDYRATHDDLRAHAEAAEAELVKVREGRDIDRRILTGMKEAAEADANEAWSEVLFLRDDSENDIRMSYRRQLAEAQAEADRLKAALETLLANPFAHSSGFPHRDDDCAWCIARAALAPADRNTT